jgi:molybdate transport system substrate-binding protein
VKTRFGPSGYSAAIYNAAGTATVMLRRAVRNSISFALIPGMLLLPGRALAAPAAPAAPTSVAGTGSRVEIAIYAAASLRDALEELAPDCERATSTRLLLNFGASGDLARQIEAAGKADLFLSADEASVDRLARKGLLDEDATRPFLSNRLAVIVPAGSRLSPTRAADLAGPPVRRLALADPDIVPAGTYARDWLRRAGVWDEVRARVVPALDVRAALALVAAGAVDAGVVYRTDARTSPKVRQAFEVGEDEGPRIVYVAALPAGRPRPETARAVLSCLLSAAAAPIFRRLGFLPPASNQRGAP